MLFTFLYILVYSFSEVLRHTARNHKSTCSLITHSNCTIDLDPEDVDRKERLPWP